MKKLMVIATAFLFLGLSTARADQDIPIQVSQLPVAAQEFIKQYFPNEKVSYAKEERDLMETTYEVIFTNSTKVEFSRNGDWREVDCRYSLVPAALVPAEITSYLNASFPDMSVVSIEKGRYGYEVKITNGLEITFDSKFNVVEIDD
ncbi:MAG TPA: PepSY-like domain-containing protein [Candidatus Coprenecus stercoripullorum]|nr:PepSY-like domain-containing protein [Candidatus Coprenecus stercoripullorum]